MNNCGDYENTITIILNVFDFEGDLWEFYIACELYLEGIVYLSHDAHYSVLKNFKILNMKIIVVDIQNNGEMDYNDFENKIDVSKPAIIFAIIDSTAIEAIEDVKIIRKTLEKKLNIYIYSC